MAQRFSNLIVLFLLIFLLIWYHASWYTSSGRLSLSGECCHSASFRYVLASSGCNKSQLATCLASSGVHCFLKNRSICSSVIIQAIVQKHKYAAEEKTPF